MKKTLLTLFIIFFIIISVLTAKLIKIKTQNAQIKKKNAKYEYYLNKEINGTDVITIINKAIEQNKKNNIQQNNKGEYINDNKHCIKVELNMITQEDTYTFQMETLYNYDKQGFIENFKSVKFKCIEIQYHKQTKEISKIIFTQIEE